MSNYRVIENVLTTDEITFFREWAITPGNIHRGNATDGRYYAEHDNQRDYDVWWTIQPPVSSWKDIVIRLTDEISELMDTTAWTIYNVDCITTKPGSTKSHAHIDFPYKFKETENMEGVLGAQIIIPLCDFTEENGGTMFTPAITVATTEEIQENQEMFNQFLLEEGIQLIAPAGTTLMYDSRTLHSTMPNKSTIFRSALLVNVLRNDCVDFVLKNDVNTDHTTRSYYVNETINT